MQDKGVKFDKSQEDKELFKSLQEEVGSETAVTREPLDTFNAKRTLVHLSESIPQPLDSTEKCSTCDTLPEDVQKQVNECIERAKLSKDEAEDLVKVVQQTQKEEIPRIFLTPRAFIHELHIKKPQARQEVKEWKPKETLEQRVAVMHPQHSKIEEALLLKLNEKGVNPITDKEFCVQSTTPDFYFPDKTLAVYVDGKVHEGKEERDDTIRGLLTKRYDIRVVAIPYSDYSQEETERVLQEILKNL